MDSSGATTKGRLRLIAINAIATIVLFFTVDFIISHTSIKYRILPDVFEVLDTRMNHVFAPNVSHATAVWGRRRYEMNTNSLGLRDSAARQVEPISDKPHRVLFLGDSFTEGIGLPWEDTFVGLFAAAYPNVEVLNGGVRSYSPSFYLQQVERLLDAGVSFDHVIIYVDISDIQDEAAAYVTDSAGNIIDYKDRPDFGAHVGDRTIQTIVQPSQEPFLERFFQTNFLVSRNIINKFYTLYRLLTQKERGAVENMRLQLKLIRSSWTIYGDLPSGYGEMGVSGGVRKALDNMTALAEILRERNIKFSVAVYPWPDQAIYDTPQSVGMTIWRDWCQSQGCTLFIDHFPDFYAGDHGPEQNQIALDKYYTIGDVHFNERGNEVIAKRLIDAFRDQFN